jgi:hypothetical protein
LGTDAPPVPPEGAAEAFGFRFSSAYRWAGRPLGITPQRCEARLSDRALTVDFGPWRFQTRVVNITDVTVTGPYWFWRTAGAARLGVTDRGLTFATNGERGVRLSFREKVPCIEPTGLLRHPELTLTVADIDGFTRRIREAIAQLG